MKKLLAIVITAALSFSLLACNKEVDPQQLYADGYKLLEEAKTYESSSTVDLNLEIEESESTVPLTAEEQQIIKTINSADIKVNSVVDTENEKYELSLDAAIEFGFIKPTIKTTLLMDMKNNMMYVDASALYDEFYMFVADMLPPNVDLSILKDHIIFADLEALSQEMEGEFSLEELTIAPEMKSSDLIASIAKENFTTLELTKEDKAKKAKNKVKLTLSNEEVKAIALDVLAKLDPEETAELDMTFIDQLTFNNFSVTTLFNKDGHIIEDEISVSFTITESEMMNSVTIDFAIITDYTNINKPVTFKINPDTDKKIDIMEVIQQVIMGQMDF
ncbi:hypothetical protein CIB95_12690 [Lottiidibacillus patelloidae]|uniref:Lipoprotein n=1 Tax=Lottiidibacillus patelloidae TaxID=2670334 RepID=A0A263BRF5_9BACI|nr:hypothetical protein [Lottiidibacillus patelloidae]OZM56275.1 hypothetical protein CIB95_12690 [Lottiidibacillus patelloidae]